jgi:hypothetical protein
VVGVANGFPHTSWPVNADRQELDPAAVYHGGILKATSGGTATVDVYDGKDTSGDLIDSFSAAASGYDDSWRDDGLLLKRGLYIDLGSNVDKFTVFYDPTIRELG